MKALLLAAVVAAAIAGAAGSAAAEPPDAVGWWTRRPGAAPLGGSGFEVAAGLQGEESVAAVRVGPLADGDAPARLVLTEAPGGAADAAFHACPATSPWEPADGGAWSARPTADCATSVDAVRAGTGRWAIDLGPLLAGGPQVDVIILPTLPEVVPGLGTSVGFRTAFTTADLVSSGDAPVATSPGPPPVASAAPTSPSRSPTAAAPPVVARPVPAAAAGLPTTAPPAAAAAGGPGVTVPTPVFDLAGGGGDDRPWGRLVLLVPISAGVGAGAAAARGAARRRGMAGAAV